VRPWEYPPQARPPSTALEPPEPEAASEPVKSEPTALEKQAVPAPQIEELELAHYDLYLSRKLLDSVAMRITEYPELRIEHPDGLILGAKPCHILKGLATYTWGIVYTAARCILLVWGDVPMATIAGLKDFAGEVVTTQHTSSSVPR
jgi:hypothetical protein